MSLAAGAVALVGVLTVRATAVPATLIDKTPPDVPTAIEVPACNKLFLVAQRINRTGGLAPAGACVSGSTASVPYTADDDFYRAAMDKDDEAAGSHP